MQKKVINVNLGIAEDVKTLVINTLNLNLILILVQN
jgi:hypothetical protein